MMSMKVDVTPHSRLDDIDASIEARSIVSPSSVNSVSSLNYVGHLGQSVSLSVSQSVSLSVSLSVTQLFSQSVSYSVSCSLTHSACSAQSGHSEVVCSLPATTYMIRDLSASPC